MIELGSIRMCSCSLVCLCFSIISLSIFFFLFISPQLMLVFTEAAPIPSQSNNNNGVYIVYTGAAASASSAAASSSLTVAQRKASSHQILSSSSTESWEDRVIHRYNNGFSGFAARLSEEEAKSIARRAQVVSVFPDPVLHLHTTRSWDFLEHESYVEFRPPRTSSSIPFSNGEDTIIGILDSGIWPEAKSFNDEGMGPIPSRWKGKCMKGPGFRSSNCNRKLIGARNYIFNDNFTSPRDKDGHGTHVAAIAAGRAVHGASYHGLARGTARGGSPGARIAVYRVCDHDECAGSGILKAFEDAIADGVDIISLSVGGSPGSDFARDPIAIGAFHAVERGITVVCSAGNEGGEAESVVNAAPWILTVGATTIDRFFESDVVLGGNKVIKAGGVHSAILQKNPIYPLIDGLSAKNPEASNDEASNCFRDSLDGEKVKGKIVLCDTFLEDYPIETRYSEVRSLGGIAMLLIENYAQLIDSVRESPPMVKITLQDGHQILSYINSTRNPVATILPSVAVAKYKPAPYVAYFSGTGPIYQDDYLIKPDIVAPGVDILAAWPSNVTDKAFNILSGTSMSCPHASGIAATIKSKYPSWSPSAIKSAMMTTAIRTDNLKRPITNNLGNPATPYNFGAGEVTTLGSLQPGLIYETEIADYLLYLCNKGYNTSVVKIISSHLPAHFSCPSDAREAMNSNMNYPSISIVGIIDYKRKTVRRTVTNVGEEESVYVASVETATEMRVQVNPRMLKFTKKIKKLSYEVTFRNDSITFLGFGFKDGSITWSNDKYRVRIPFVVT